MMNIQWSRIARTGLWLAVGILAGGVAAARFPGESGPGAAMAGYCEHNVCSAGGCKDTRPPVRSNCNMLGVGGCTNYPCPPERPFPELVNFAEPENGRMLMESGVPGLRALMDRIRARRQYLQANQALETLAEMADRGWFWRDHIEEGDWKGMYEIATAYLTASPLYLAGSQRASTLTAAISLALAMRESLLPEGDREALTEQVRQLVGNRDAVLERVNGDSSLADQVIRHATELLGN
ncbi:MAG: hypothetical protein OXL34_03830 [Gemmatimonadota bacterium]|nr:hypothetical protein [Gemmatimonadota bacterium]